MTDYSREDVVLAALLHDLGKIAQRAEADHLLTPGMEGLLLPYRDGRFTHKHAWYTHGAVLKLKDSLPDFFNVEKVARLAASHHNPSDWAEWIIAESDRISSGADRTERELESEGKGNAKEQACLSVFSSVKLKTEAHPQEVFYKINPLSPDNSVPTTTFRNSVASYKTALDGLLSDLSAIRSNSFDSWILAADAALEHWTWAIPSTTIDQPDISLYDHLRTTATFADVLYGYHEKNKNLDIVTAIKDLDSKKFLFVSGDVSGIQKYIFDIKTDTSSSKLVRARSFELGAISASAARKIQRKFDLSHFAQISNAGGRFLMMLPNNNDSSSLLEQIIKEIELEMLNKYFGFVSFVLSKGIEASKRDLNQDAFSDLFALIMADSTNAKHKKLQSALSEHGHIMGSEYEKIEAAIREGGSVCPVCEMRAKQLASDACIVCSSLTKLGSILPKAASMYISKAGKDGFLLLDGEYLKLQESKAEQGAANGFISIHEYVKGAGLARMPYIAPRTDYEIMDFATIAKRAKGAKHLAMFKADLDSLGAVFSFGLGKTVSISRYATLSRTLDYFFSTVIRDLIEKNEDFKYIYSVFSGGDDLCVLGPWDVILDFAIKVQTVFLKFTGANSDLTISAGIALSHAGVPVSRIAEMAEDELQKAKEQKNKNSISLFGLAMSWEEYKDCLVQGKLLAEELKNNNISAASIYSLIENSKKAEEFDKGNIAKDNALWKSHYEYALRRSKAKEEAKNIMKGYAVNARLMIASRIAASYALYINRKGEEL